MDPRTTLEELNIAFALLQAGLQALSRTIGRFDTHCASGVLVTLPDAVRLRLEVAAAAKKLTLEEAFIAAADVWARNALALTDTRDPTL